MTQTPDGLGVELRFLDDRLLDTLDAWLAWGGVLPIGDGGETTTMLAAVEAQVLEQADWEDLAAQTASTAWDIRLLTPTVFTSRGHHVPEVTAASLATSLHARWRHWCRPLAPDLPERERLTSVLITQDRTRRTVVGLGMPRADRRGRLSSRRIPASVGTLRISAPAAGSITAVFSQLMALARYTSVGSHSAYGMGVIDVVADAPSGAGTHPGPQSAGPTVRPRGQAASNRPTRPDLPGHARREREQAQWDLCRAIR